jgi:hypothetical protein
MALRENEGCPGADRQLLALLACSGSRLKRQSSTLSGCCRRAPSVGFSHLEHYVGGLYSKCAKPAEIKALFNNTLDPAGAAFLQDKMLAAGLPI